RRSDHQRGAPDHGSSPKSDGGFSKITGQRLPRYDPGAMEVRWRASRRTFRRSFPPVSRQPANTVGETPAMKDSAFVLSPLDTVIIAASLLIVVLVGIWASKGQSETARGYFLASERLPWWVIGSAFVSTSVSSEQIVGTVGAAYEHGMAIANWEWWCLPTYTLLLLLFIPVYLKNRIATVPEFLSKRFGPLCGDIYSWVMLAAYVLVFQVPVLYGSTLVFSKLTGWSFFAVLWGTVALVGLYSIKGGLASVMWTDAVQCVMLLGGGIILYFVAIANIPGGWAAMAAANPERFHLYRPPDDPMAPFLGLITGSLGV